MASIAACGILVAAPVLCEVQSSIEANVVDYVELDYVLTEGEHYDHRPPSEDQGPMIVLPEGPAVPTPLGSISIPLTDHEAPEFIDGIWDVTSGSTPSTADPELAVGPTHLIAVTNTGVFGFVKADGTSVLSMSLGSFFASLTPNNEPYDPVAFYDDFEGRFVVMALDADPLAPASDLLVAVSATGDPTGIWNLVKIPTTLQTFDPDGPGPEDPAPHWSDRPTVGIEASQVYVSFNMLDAGGFYGGTTIWDIWKDGLYDGGTTTIHAGIRPFSAGSDYDNEVPLRPARIHGAIVGDPVDRGTFLVGYQGRQIGGSPALQMFWLTTVGPSVTKYVVSLGSVDDLSGGNLLPNAPQRNSGTMVATGQRFIYSAEWRDGTLWLVTTMVPPSGSDAGEVTAHWIELDVPTPVPVGLTDQGNISGDDLVAGAHTYYPSLSVNPEGVVAIGYAISASNLELSSALSFIGLRCDEPQVALAPELLRRGTAVWEGPSGRWGDYSDTVWDSGLCFWTHNIYPIVGGVPTWQSTVGRFCIDPAVIFGDGFESGSTVGWCS